MARHCQSCERQISAVAASSIRLLIAAAPLPRSHESRYWSATDTFGRTPASVTAAGDRQVEQLGRSDRDLGRRTRLLVGPRPEDAVEDLGRERDEVGMGDPRPVEAVARLALLVLADAGHRRGVDLRVAARGMNAAIPPIAWAPRRWQVWTSSSV